MHISYKYKYAINSLPSHKAIYYSNSDLCFLSPPPDTSLHCQATDTELVHHVPVYVPGFASTHCTYPWRNGQAELTLR